VQRVLAYGARDASASIKATSGTEQLLLVLLSVGKVTSPPKSLQRTGLRLCRFASKSPSSSEKYFESAQRELLFGSPSQP